MSGQRTIGDIINTDPAFACLDFFRSKALPPPSLQQAIIMPKKPTTGNIIMAYAANAERSDLFLSYTADHQWANWFGSLQALHTITVTVQHPDLEEFAQEVLHELKQEGIEPNATFTERGMTHKYSYTFLTPRPELGKEVETLMQYFQKRYGK